MSLFPNSTLSHYRIISKIGAGGMGEVYLAEDALLDRRVALKVLPETLVTDEQAKKRLMREARAAAKLDHPNVCSIYEVGEVDGRTFIVMQFVEGMTLADQLAHQNLDLKELLNVSIQVAAALAEAHSRGIIHRDIKPQNIMLTTEGQVKVLDFGLARPVTDRNTLQSEANTQSMLTAPGTVVGTVSYMSPEQATGKSVDPRSDIFAVGALLYEMASGKRAFRGDSQMAILASILNQEPEPLPAKVPEALVTIIKRCLRKDPARRFQTMADLKVALEDLRDQLAAIKKVATSSPLTRLTWAIPVTLVLLFVVVLFAWQFWKEAAPAEPLRAVALTTLPGVEQSPSLSPDGGSVVFSWSGPRQDNQDIYVQLIGQGSPLQLTKDPRHDYNPVWSPDGRWIAFFRSDPPAPTGVRSRELRLIPPLGGTERKLTDVRGQDVAYAESYLCWSADSKFVVVTDSPGEGQPDALFVVSLESGTKRQLTHPVTPVVADISPAISPDGSSLIFLRRTTWGAGELQLLPLKNDMTSTAEPKRLTPIELRAENPTWTPDGNEVVFSAKGNLWRMPVTGDSAPTQIPYVGDDALMPVISHPPPGKPARLVYVHSFTDENFWKVETSAAGAPSTSGPVKTIASTKSEYHIRFSPDGRRVAFSSGRSGSQEIWISDPDGSNASQLTSMDAQDTMCPFWSPDGQLIAFASNAEGEFDLYVIPAAGGKPQRLTSNPGIDICPSFSRDGKSIYFASMRSGDYRVWKMPATGGDAVQITPNQGGAGAIESVDGRTIYYNPVSVLGSVWSMPTSGGKPSQLIDGVVWFNYCVLEKGIYYIDRFADDTRLQYFNFSTGKSTTVAHNLGEVAAGLTATPDGKTILFNHVDSAVDDLMLVENFR